MRCALFCIKKLSEYYEYKTENVINELQDAIQKNGISVFDLISICHTNDIELKAFKSTGLIKAFPCILLLRPRSRGHYIVLLEVNRWTCLFSDETYGIRKMSKLRLYLYWSHVSVICYNEKRKEEISC